MRRFRVLLVALILIVVVWWWLAPAPGPKVAPGTILVVNVGGRYVEAAEPSLFSRLMGDRRRPFVSLLSELRKAERDDRLSAVVLRIRDLQVGWGKAQEIRDAIASLERSGRPTVAYLEVQSFRTNLEYYVATAAGRVVEAPGTRTALVGLAAEFLFFGGMFEKAGIDVEVERIGRYKTATDTFAGSEMTPAHREMADSLLDSLDAQYVSAIAQGRKLNEAAVRAAIESAPMTPREMLELKLIDGISHYDEVIASLGNAPVVKGSDYATVGLSAVGIEPVATFALVYGSGVVMLGEGSATRTGNPVLASDTISSALREAADSEEVSAIILRLDSPGGSALASELVWRALQQVRLGGKPVIASISDVAASGGYYIAVGADQVVAPAGSLTGSIGVYVMRPVLGGMFEKLGIGVQPITRGPRADLLLSSQPLSEASRERLRAEIAGVYELFLRRVAIGRSLDPAQVDTLGQGRVWTGAQAVEAGLVDGVGGLRAAVNRAKDKLGIDPGADVALMTFPAPKSMAEQISEALTGLRARTLSELMIPETLRALEPWLVGVPEGAPALLPPVFVDIR
jgi:protease-4